MSYWAGGKVWNSECIDLDFANYKQHSLNKRLDCVFIGNLAEIDARIQSEWKKWLSVSNMCQCKREHVSANLDLSCANAIRISACGEQKVCMQIGHLKLEESSNFIYICTSRHLYISKIYHIILTFHAIDI